ncbi:hypothetical protein NEOLI_003648 [Neolecta irregularis DAH-3]|uniref:Mannosyl-oligosaccharide glucosidase n=1 Tax=Neolecta irregularis (strain DAH-3) TaxID=1198029 RepID=A0A1U7LSR6_NEOID|nr:hypothetical protein NEOLI_003648 [Neolecta irregularis DAH-3]|eukprot:OLL25658.1 hypothetical protein NEOLI_003648 [Neolecta irregularis DAH-3]
MVIYMGSEHTTAEEHRLNDDRKKRKVSFSAVQLANNNFKYGPYLSERQWATVREDYSADGDAWSNFPHDHARSRAFRWGEDGIGGYSDTHSLLCMSFAFWNERDPYLKERLYGLTGHEGNHGEDVKELYYYLDSTPTHSYMKYLYKYPQKEYPYEKLVEENAKRSRKETEFEITDTNMFENNKYWDIFIEYAKDDDNPHETLIRIAAVNRGSETASLHIIPQMWFRNTWSWGIEAADKKPHIKQQSSTVAHAKHWDLGDRYLQCSSSPGPTDDLPDVLPTLLYTDNNTNKKRLYNVENESPYVKDAFHEHIVDDKRNVTNPRKEGTKVGAWFFFEEVPPGECAVVRVKFSDRVEEGSIDEEIFDNTMEKRRLESDDFYWRISPSPMSDDLRNIQRQALAGMLWSKQHYLFIHDQWAYGDPLQPPPPPERKHIRNQHWRHLHIDDVLSMPDKWEYPFFAAWDTAFHCIPLTMVDPDFAKKQLDLLTREWHRPSFARRNLHYSDVNPPVHAWATFRVFKMERKLYGREDLDFLERVFQKLLLNFTWWVNRKDEEGSNVFEGGFLGLDNIGLFNRSEPLPTGGRLMQADGTSWMAFYCLSMLNISLELAKYRRTYEDIASKFFEHFLFISDAMSFRSGDNDVSLWNEEDEFYYDCISWGGPWRQSLPVKSLVGLIPLYAVLTLEPEIVNRFPSFKKRLNWFIENRSKVANRNIASMKHRGKGDRMMLALVNKDRLVKILQKMLDEDEFLSQYGIRSLSKYHQEHPYSMNVNGQEFQVDYVPGDSNSGLFGGNSNWRGPIWLATTFLLIESLQRFYLYYGDTLKVECPTGSGNFMHLGHVAEEIQHRVQHIFVRDESGRRAANGGNDLLDFNPYFKDHVLFHEFFHADDGSGLGASHQLGWTGLVAKLIHDTGLTCRLPKTPKTPTSAANHYFDEVFSHVPRPRHRRTGTGRSLGNRSDFDDAMSQYTVVNDDKDKEANDERIEQITQYLQQMESGGDAMSYEHADEFEVEAGLDEL